MYLLHNDLHEEVFGFGEDWFVDESLRNKGIGTQLVKKMIEEGEGRGRYKIILTSRHSNEHVHRICERFGFKNHGVEFRLDF